jgi:hypothetical protein
MCTLLVTLTVSCLVSVGEFAWFLIFTLLVMLTVSCLVSVSELAWFLMCTLLVMLTVACLVSDGGLAGAFIVLSCGNIYFGSFF